MAELVCPKCGASLSGRRRSLRQLSVRLYLRHHSARRHGTSGKYEVQQLLHSGGMGYIYLVKDKDLFDRLCVLKQVRERIRSEEHLKKLEEEALRMSRLNHPNIAMIFDHFIESGYYFLVEEYISGKTLSEVFRERQDPLDEDEVVSWAISICDVIAYIHPKELSTGI